jgi:hypothetical protein
MFSKVRAKFTVEKVSKTRYGGTELTLSPQYDETIPEDRRFAKATPSGSLTMYVDNPPAAEFFKLGEAYYLDFIPALPETVTERCSRLKLTHSNERAGHVRESDREGQAV